MAITTLAIVKTLASLYTRTALIAPTTATSGEIGDILLDTVTGLTYELTEIVTTPSTSYTWTTDTSLDAKITLFISKAEQDYLSIRGIDFEIDDNDAIVYPDGADIVAGEMVCSLLGLSKYTGRGKASEALGGRSVTYEPKVNGYTISIVGSIERYQHVV